jgi:hypothetical protein
MAKVKAPNATPSSIVDLFLAQAAAPETVRLGIATDVAAGAAVQEVRLEIGAVPFLEVTERFPRWAFDIALCRGRLPASAAPLRAASVPARRDAAPLIPPTSAVAAAVGATTGILAAALSALPRGAARVLAATLPATALRGVPVAEVADLRAAHHAVDGAAAG